MAFTMRGHMLPGIKQRVEEAGVCESCYCADCQCSPSPTKQISKGPGCAAYGGKSPGGTAEKKEVETTDSVEAIS